MISDSCSATDNPPTAPHLTACTCGDLKAAIPWAAVKHRNARRAYVAVRHTCTCTTQHHTTPHAEHSQPWPVAGPRGIGARRFLRCGEPVCPAPWCYCGCRHMIRAGFACQHSTTTTGTAARWASPSGWRKHRPMLGFRAHCRGNTTGPGPRRARRANWWRWCGSSQASKPACSHVSLKCCDSGTLTFFGRPMLTRCGS